MLKEFLKILLSVNDQLFIQIKSFSFSSGSIITLFDNYLCNFNFNDFNDYKISSLDFKQDDKCIKYIEIFVINE